MLNMKNKLNSWWCLKLITKHCYVHCTELEVLTSEPTPAWLPCGFQSFECDFSDLIVDLHQNSILLLDMCILVLKQLIFLISN